MQNRIVIVYMCVRIIIVGTGRLVMSVGSKVSKKGKHDIR